MYILQTKYGNTYWVDAHHEQFSSPVVACFRAQEIASQHLGPAVRVFNLTTRKVVATYAPGGGIVPPEVLP
jgi:hypothetical protein